jgi:general stress protein 26
MVGFMSPESQSCSEITQLTKLIEMRSIGMLTCLDYGGALVSQPITPLKIDSLGAIWFFIDIRAGSASHLYNINLSFTEMYDENYVSLSGGGEICKNQTDIEGLWYDSFSACFPDGPKSINIALLKFTPYAVKCWDVSQSKMVRVYSMIASTSPSISIVTTAPQKLISAPLETYQRQMLAGNKS